MSVSSIEGNFLFFSGGITIYDKNTIRMPNGDLPASPFRYTAIQPIVGFQNFDNPSQYHIFHIKEGGLAVNGGNPRFFRSFVEGELYYSVIDMTLNDGKGDVLANQKNILLKTGITGGMVVLQG